MIIPEKEDYIKFMEAALTRHGFKTSDIVRISGRRTARIMGRNVKFGAHAFTALVLLAEQALATPGEYFATEAIVFALKSSQRRLGELGLSWADPTLEGVHKAVCQIRVALKKAGLDESLIESGRGQGYRLNTPAMNILVDPAQGITCHMGKSGGMFLDNELEQRELRKEPGSIVRPLR